MDKVLFVDDEVSVLEGMKRNLRKKYIVETAVGGKNGLKNIMENGPFPVVVSDMRMPGMDGAQFLSVVRKEWPDTIRILLTGQADLESAIAAVNHGNIFRFLTKPCSVKILADILDQGIRQYNLLTAEKELLEKTLKGSITLLSELLSLLNPEALGRASRIKRYALGIAEILDVPDIWEIETAVMLSQIGCVLLPEPAMKKLYRGEELNEEEKQLFDMHPMVASDLLSHIPRMQNIASIIAYQEKHFDGTGNPRDDLQGESIPLGARILKIVLDFDLLESKGLNKSQALKQIKERQGWYDPSLVKSLETILGYKARYESKELSIAQLDVRMILRQEVRSESGQLLIPRGHEISQLMIERFKNFARQGELKGTISVLVPLKPSTEGPTGASAQ